MSSLGIESAPQAVPVKKKSLWDKVITVCLSLVITLFAWIVVSNGYLLIFQKPLINLH
ncbi:MAG: hypothetical protein LAN63_14545 [Acidobacteriia bacterium]|nr:hypothetical protein [Terriglobia bacterium]